MKFLLTKTVQTAFNGCEYRVSYITAISACRRYEVRECLSAWRLPSIAINQRGPQGAHNVRQTAWPIS